MKTRIILAIAVLVGCSPAADISKIYVLSNGGKPMVTTYSPDGQQTGTFAPGGCCHTGIALDPAGKIFVSANSPVNTIAAFTPEGTPTPSGMGAMNAQRIVIDRDDLYILVRDASNYAVIIRFTRTGGRIKMPIDTRPTYISMAVEGGKIYILEPDTYMLKRFDMSGHLLDIVKTGTNDGRSLAVDASGKMYIGTTYGGIYSLQASGERTALRSRIIIGWRAGRLLQRSRWTQTAKYMSAGTSAARMDLLGSTTRTARVRERKSRRRRDSGDSGAVNGKGWRCGAGPFRHFWSMWGFDLDLDSQYNSADRNCGSKEHEDRSGSSSGRFDNSPGNRAR
jgi:hypothetical protein